MSEKAQKLLSRGLSLDVCFETIYLHCAHCTLCVWRATAQIDTVVGCHRQNLLIQRQLHNLSSCCIANLPSPHHPTHSHRLTGNACENFVSATHSPQIMRHKQRIFMHIFCNIIQVILVQWQSSKSPLKSVGVMSGKRCRCIIEIANVDLNNFH